MKDRWISAVRLCLLLECFELSKHPTRAISHSSKPAPITNPSSVRIEELRSNYWNMEPNKMLHTVRLSISRLVSSPNRWFEIVTHGCAVCGTSSSKSVTSPGGRNQFYTREKAFVQQDATTYMNKGQQKKDL